LEAKKSRYSAVCAKRSEDPQSKGEGFNEPNGGYMKVELEASALETAAVLSGRRDGGGT